jgi:FtsZ-interacting cell division protein ZipA
MSDLQISLLIIGAVVVGGVYLFNWTQERKFRRKLGQAFEVEREDVLLGATAKSGARVEPQVSWADTPPAADLPESETTERKPAPSTTGEPAQPPPFDPDLEYVAVIEGAAPLAETAINELLNRTAACGKPCRAAGLRARSSEWEELARAGGDHYVKVALALQLVNRTGPVNAAQLAMFCDAMRNCAGKIAAVATCPDTQAALQAAHELDEFCAEVDVAIGVNIVAAESQTFPGARIRSLAEAAGFKLEPDGLFHFRNDQRHNLFTLDNHEPAPFLPEQINRLSTSGVTLLLDVPRVANGPSVLDRMLEVGRDLAQALDGRLVDDNRVVLNEAGIDRIRHQLAEICSRMEASGVSAGGARALRLFS